MADTVEMFFAAYRAHDVERMVAMCAPDGSVEYVPMGDEGRGPIAEVGRRIWSSLIDAFPDLTNAVRSVIDDRADNAAAEVVIGGTQAKEFAGIPSKGRRYSLPHGFFFHFDGEHRIDRVAAYWDNVSFRQQLE